jgi:hypothetical protein
MSVFAELRALVFLRRIAIAQEQLVAIESERLENERKQWRPLKRPRATEFASFDAEAANREWLAAQEAGEVGGTLEDRSR